MPPFHPGAVLGDRYVLERLFEDDGITQAWTATDQVLARPVMVDALPPDADPATREAFVAAVASSARLGHPGVVATYDSGTVDGGSYVVTERPTGSTLAAVLERQGPFTPARAAGIGRQLARALEAAHHIGVVHGGVGPETIILGEDDRARLGQFAACGTRARLRFGGPGSQAGDIQALARTLTGLLSGPLPRPLVETLAAAQPGGAITSATAFADALDAATAAMSPGGASTGTGRPSPTPRAAAGPPARAGTRSEGRPDGAAAAGTATAAVARTPAGAARAPALPPPVVTRPPAGPRTPPAGAPRVGGPSRAPMVTGVVVSAVLVVAIAITAFVLVNNSGGGPSTGSGGTGLGGDLALTGAHSFNPLGHPPGQTENEAAVAHLIDRDTSTVWSTSEYAGRRFGNLKSGTGAYVTLSSTHTLHQLTVTSPSRQWIFSVYAAAQPGQDLAAWGAPIGHPVTVTSDVTQVDLSGAKGAAVLIWITDLGQPLARPDVAGLPYRVDVAEMALR